MLVKKTISFTLLFVFVISSFAQQTTKPTATPTPAATPAQQTAVKDKKGNDAKQTTKSTTAAKTAPPAKPVNSMKPCVQPRFALNSPKRKRTANSTRKSNKQASSRNTIAKSKKSSPPLVAKPYAVKADFDNMTIQIGQSKTMGGSLTMSDGNTLTDYADVVDVSTTSNLNAHKEGGVVVIYSTLGGNGEVYVYNKQGTHLKTISITSPAPINPLVGMMDTMQKSFDAFTSSTALSATTLQSSMFWIIVLLVLIVLLLIANVIGTFATRSAILASERSLRGWLMDIHSGIARISSLTSNIAGAVGKLANHFIPDALVPNEPTQI